MMNMFKLSEQLKDFSKDQLVREMKMPSGAVPQFLVLTELQRRTRMEREAQASDGPEQSTVAQDAVVAAGMPQSGVAQMAQALAPKTDMAGNTGIAAMAPQAEPVRRMQEGGITDVPSIAEILDEARRPPRPYADLLDAPSTTDQLFGDLPPIQGPPAAAPRSEAERTVDAVRVLEAAGLPREDIDSFISSGADPNILLTQLPPGTSTEEVEAMRPDNPFRAATEVVGRTFAPDPLLPPDDETLEPTPLPMTEGEPLTVPEEGVETLLPPAAPDGGGGGGAGGGAGDIFGDSDRMFEQDKWLSLARFGLGLMSSSQPTLGGAIGEAGAAALDSLGEARDEMLQRRLAQAQLARSGGGGGGGGGMGLDLDRRDIEILDTRIETLRDQVLNAETEGARLAAQNQLTAALQQRRFLEDIYAASTLGPAGFELFQELGAPPSEEPVMEARPGLLGRVRDAFGGE